MTKEDKEAIVRRLEAMYGEAEDNETKEALFYATEALKTDIDIQDAYEQGYACGWKERFGEPQRQHGEWIPITYRPMDEEEYEDIKKEFGELPIEERKMFSCPMPEDDQEILVCTSWGRVSQDRCVMDECGYGLEENGDWDGIVAWMPLPEPYKGGEAE